MIGGGVIGRSTAWRLAKDDEEVMLFDPLFDHQKNSQKALNGSRASLGVLMGYVFRRFNGRSWRLRKESMDLWPQWIKELKSENNPLHLNTPLVQLASSEKEAEFMNKLIKKKSHLGLQELNSLSIKENNFNIIKPNYGGLISYHDGRIDPNILLNALKDALKDNKVITIQEKVTSIERKSINSVKQWLIHTKDGKKYERDIIVICAANSSKELLEPLGYKIELSPVAGQAIELEVNQNYIDLKNFPAVLVNHGTNLIPKNKNRILIGATIEPGNQPKSQFIDEMIRMEGFAPTWIQEATVVKKWYGLRSRPINKPAPILEKLEPGLILATGHYRNGILLAPATAEWVINMISKKSY